MQVPKREPKAVKALLSAGYPDITGGNIVTVSNGTDLANEIARSNITQTIKVQNGNYDNATYVGFGAPHTVMGINPFQARIRFGFHIPNFATTGVKIRGLQWDMTDPTKCLNGSIIEAWGTGAPNLTVEDCFFQSLGSNWCTGAIVSRVPSGLTVKRVGILGMTDYGVFWQAPSPTQYSYVPAVPPYVSDVTATQIHRPVRGSSNGTAESALWASTQCKVERIRIDETGWAGIWTGGNCNNSVIQDFEITNVNRAFEGGVGVYIEHFTRRTTFRYGKIYDGAKQGFVTEWADPAYDGLNPISNEGFGAAHNSIIQDVYMETENDGVYALDSENQVVLRCKFVGQKFAAIREFRTGNTDYNLIYHNLDNDYTEMGRSAVTYTNIHNNFVEGY